ncbi:fimbrial protein [Intestinirhabdus alba]|jgi:type 1 fimbria pilin|uniref:Fimbrial protein n=1 Tax=Intestinirhabdus alba TaxID=2899544 RepID=A0A6L6IJT5_9ENTR|nr:fimbrial protein [Intestinirhabdus alba]MTH44963.1 fimbrial protein [Intestinirhabdus alba]
MNALPVRVLALPLLLLLFSGGPAQAGTIAATLTVKVTVNAPPCNINDGRAITVDFGDEVMTSKVESGIYSQNVDYILDCAGAAADTLNMTIGGVGAGFDATVLQASQPDLGIRLSGDGKVIPLNTPLAIRRSAPPVLRAQLVKAPGGSLTAGAFSASATLTVAYQ